MKRWPSILGLLLASQLALADTQTISIIANADNGIDEGGVWTADFIGIDITTQAGFSFVPTSQIVAGSTITAAYLSIHCNFDDTTGLTSNVGVQDADPDTNPTWSSGNLPSAAAFYTPNSTGSVNYATSTRFLGQGQTGATNIASQIQALLDEYGTIETNDRINVRVDVVSGDGGSAQFSPLSAGGGNQPQLFIEWTPPGGGGVAKVRMLESIRKGAGPQKSQQLGGMLEGQ